MALHISTFLQQCMHSMHDTYMATKPHKMDLTLESKDDSAPWASEALQVRVTMGELKFSYFLMT